ncbi:IucA/IucC family protein [Dankookia sp. GCM10030260]|uniref:IucA/IucC family protein n=1 Tax=Dankookia sp. GCM10030260 TaxID=3273390 RepID=UPI0036102933
MTCDATATDGGTPTEQGAAEAFLNSLAREWPECRLRPAKLGWDLEMPVTSLSGVLRVAVTHRSCAGRHGLRLPVRFCPDGGAERPIAWATAVAAMAETLAIERGLPPATARRFVERVLESIDTIEAMLPGNRGPEVAATDFLAAEQALLLGHFLHPAPRSAAELRPERARFLPGLSPGFRLHWALVLPEAFASEDVGGRAVKALLHDLGAPREPGWLALPMHPWQARHLATLPAVEALRRAGMLRFQAQPEAGPLWHPTASVRSLYSTEAPWMLKTSLGARITNSVRTLFPAELQRGKDVSRLLRSTLGPSIAALAPRLTFLEEPAHLGLRHDGELLPDSLVILRDNPFRGAAARDAAMLATLCQTDPQAGRTPLAGVVAAAAASAGLSLREAGLDWLGRFAELLPLALARLRCHHGLLFGAHGQNAVLRLRHGWPVQAYVRDCQGSGHVESAHARLVAAVPGIGEPSESVVPDAVGDRLLGYYVVVNGLFGLVAALSRDGLAEEAAMFRLLRAKFERARADRPPDPSFLDYILDSPALAAKGNFMTFLEDVIENRGSREQHAIYHDLPNPLHMPVAA